MQPHDDKARVAIVNDLSRFFGRITRDDQCFRLRTNPRRNDRQQPVERLLGGDPAIGLQPRDILAGQQKASRRLDNVQQNDGNAQCLGQAAGDPRLMCRTGRQVDWHDDSAQELPRLFDVNHSRIHRWRDEHWHVRLSQHPLGRRSKEEFARARQPMRAHHDQLAGPLARNPKNLDRRLADSRLVFTHRHRRRAIAEHLRHKAGDLLLRQLTGPHNTRAHIHCRREQRIFDAQYNQACEEVLGDRRCVTKRCRRRIRVVNRTQD